MTYRKWQSRPCPGLPGRNARPGQLVNALLMLQMLLFIDTVNALECPPPEEPLNLFRRTKVCEAAPVQEPPSVEAPQGRACNVEALQACPSTAQGPGVLVYGYDCDPQTGQIVGPQSHRASRQESCICKFEYGCKLENKKLSRDYKARVAARSKERDALYAQQQADLQQCRENLRQAEERAERARAERRAEHERQRQACDREAEQEAQRQAEADRQRKEQKAIEDHLSELDPKCVGAAKGTNCWKEVSSQPGCYVFYGNSDPDWAVTWSGACSNGLAGGQGTLGWSTHTGKPSEQHIGTISDGRRTGHWVMRFSNGQVNEGPYMNGLRHGQWVFHFPSGEVLEAAFINGVLQESLSAGTPEPTSGPGCAGASRGTACWNKISNKPGCYYFEDEFEPEAKVTWSGVCRGSVAHGAGTLELKNNSHETLLDFTGSITDGRRQGHWVMRTLHGSVSEGPYVDGSKHGHWVLRDENGNVSEGPYVNGERHGHWVESTDVIQRAEGQYINGTPEGSWFVRYTSGECLDVEYSGGNIVSHSSIWC